MKNDTSQTERALVAQAQQELPYVTAAYERLMARYESQLHAVALRYLGNPQEAEEVVQDAMLKAFFGLPKFRRDSSFKTWLYRILYNECASRYRREKRHSIVTTEEDVGERAEPAGSSDSDASLDEVQRILAPLAEGERDVVLLRLVAGLEFSEIAEAMQIGLSAAKMRYQRALEKLREVHEELR